MDFLENWFSIRGKQKKRPPRDTYHLNFKCSREGRWLTLRIVMKVERYIFLPVPFSKKKILGTFFTSDSSNKYDI